VVIVKDVVVRLNNYVVCVVVELEIGRGVRDRGRDRDRERLGSTALC
jgi:hypothetical protein